MATMAAPRTTLALRSPTPLAGLRVGVLLAMMASFRPVGQLAVTGSGRRQAVLRPRLPEAGGGRVACVFAEVPRLAAEGALDAVGEAGVAAVEDLAEDEGQHLD